MLIQPPNVATSPAQPWARDVTDLLAALRVNPETGLPTAEANARLAQFGRNQLRKQAPRQAAHILFDQFRSAVVVLLAVAAMVAMLLGEAAEGLAILAVIALNTAIGFTTEWRATRSMESLQRMGVVETVVRRDGRTQRLAAERLVPGDIVLVEAGDILTADLRLIESSKLAVDESALTGESVPVRKSTSRLPADTALMDRDNMLFKGTAVTRGSGVAVITGTGAATELGQISRLVASAQSVETPLQKRLDSLGRRLVWLMLVLATLLAVTGVLAGRDLWLALEVAIALAVAAIPEGLPVVATIALARGMWRMARRNALISRLSAVETLGATGVIMTDKTGTLTENRMTVSMIQLPDRQVSVGGTGLATTGRFEIDGMPATQAELERVDALLVAATLCTNATLERQAGGQAAAVGDPTEVALLIAAAKRKLSAEDLRRKMPEVREVAFEPDSRAMATFNRSESGLRVNVKGAPEAVLKHCSHERLAGGVRPLDESRREELIELAHQLAHQGYRLLAVATRKARTGQEEPYQDLEFLGLAAMADPPRDGVRQAIDRCRSAGIQVVMITGDHAGTARRIAIDLGLIDEHSPADTVRTAESLFGESGLENPDAAVRLRVIARATPAQKLEFIDLYQRRGWIVAMTGDGVNDAPALRKADIGVAMGIRGTAVAREAAAMVLRDDEFSSIVEAVRQGRAIYANIRKFVVYLFSCNVSEILVVTLATVAGAPLPLLPLQILFLNLVTDVFPALALGVGPGSVSQMERGPRPPDEPLVTRSHWRLIIAFGTVMSASVLGAMATAEFLLGLSRESAVTVSFCTLAVSQLWHVFNMRDKESGLLRNEVTANIWIWGAIALCLALVLTAIYVPRLALLLQLTDPGTAGWIVILSFSALPLLLAAPVRRLAGRNQPE